MVYVGTIYRPPSEAKSLILQVTVGCSQNSCTFCTMYKDKKFRIKSDEEIDQVINWTKEYYEDADRIFLADGDAIAMESKKLASILRRLYHTFPSLKRITSYASPKSLLEKTPEELKMLKDAGLDMVYLGLESGSPEVLKNIRKGVTPKDMINAAEKIKAAGITLSVTIILGLGGKNLSLNHAHETAKTLNLMQPDYLGALTLMVEPNSPLFHQVAQGEFQILEAPEVLEELKTLVKSLDLKKTVFRTNHASNYYVVKGSLPEDRDLVLDQIDKVLSTMEDKGRGFLKPESYRAL